MDWQGQRESDNVVDERGMHPGVVAGGGLGTLVLALVIYALGGNPSQLLNQSTQAMPTQRQAIPQDAESERRVHFVKTVLASTEDVWTKIFSQRGMQYKNPKLVLFTGQVNSACGNATAAVGPFYCGGDQKVYIDLSFYDMLSQRFKSPGEFAQAYVVAHEVGHHVQNLLGIMDKVHQAQQGKSEAQANALSVRLELQADFLAGVWGHHAGEQFKLNEADLESALTAANAIGDDTLEKEAQGRVVPDSFTHGTSAQRVKWFKKGWDSGNLDDGDTFNATDL